jgi:hypothetical protein
MIMPCIKSTSAFEGFRKGAFAVSGVRVLLVFPGAPGCTIVTPPEVAFGCWHHVITALAASNPAAKSRNLGDMTFLTSKSAQSDEPVIAQT